MKRQTVLFVRLDEEDAARLERVKRAHRRGSSNLVRLLLEQEEQRIARGKANGRGRRIFDVGEATQVA